MFARNNVVRQGTAIFVSCHIIKAFSTRAPLVSPQNSMTVPTIIYFKIKGYVVNKISNIIHLLNEPISKSIETLKVESFLYNC